VISTCLMWLKGKINCRSFNAFCVVEGEAEVNRKNSGVKVNKTLVWEGGVRPSDVLRDRAR
jgi:hypothetical protein